jgi:hypothetical protein
MNKLAQFANNARALGARQALIKLSNAGQVVAQGVEHAAPSALARILPKTRIGRLGALGALGAGAFALGNNKEENMMDKATNYINNIDPSTINTAMGLYSQLANPTAMGYSPDASMGVDYAQHMNPGYEDEYLEDLEKTSQVKQANKLMSILKGLGIGGGVGLGAVGAGKAINPFLSEAGAIKSGLQHLSEMGLAGAGSAALAGGTGAYLAARARAAANSNALKEVIKDTSKAVSKAHPRPMAPAYGYAPPPMPYYY